MFVSALTFKILGNIILPNQQEIARNLLCLQHKNWPTCKHAKCQTVNCANKVANVSNI